MKLFGKRYVSRIRRDTPFVLMLLAIGRSNFFTPKLHLAMKHLEETGLYGKWINLESEISLLYNTRTIQYKMYEKLRAKLIGSEDRRITLEESPSSITVSKVCPKYFSSCVL